MRSLDRFASEEPTLRQAVTCFQPHRDHEEPARRAYVVPWNAWNATGPQGAGYYRATPGGGSELLDVQP